MTDLATHPAFLDGSFGHLRLGRIKPTEPAKLRLEPFVDEAAFVAPPAVDHYSDVPSWPMYENDELGDCTWATVGHIIQALSAAAGGEKTMADSDIVRGYWETGSPPAATGTAGSATDDGRMETTVLSYWRRTGVAPNTSYTDRIIAYAGVNVANQTKIKATCAMLGTVYIGIAMPLTAQSQQIWDVEGNPADPNSPAYPGSWGGHAVPIVGYDETYFYVVTWGGLLKMTPAFFAAYVDEAYAVISSDFLGASPAAQGVNLDALQTDLATLTAGSPPDPEPTGADLPAEPAPAATVPTETPEPASAPEVPAQHAWNASAAPGVVTAADEEGAKTMYLRMLATNPDLLTVTPV